MRPVAPADRQASERVGNVPVVEQADESLDVVFEQGDGPVELAAHEVAGDLLMPVETAQRDGLLLRERVHLVLGDADPPDPSRKLETCECRAGKCAVSSQP